MATFEARPKISIRLDTGLRTVQLFMVYMAQFPVMRSDGAWVLDVDVAEKAVAWLKAHGVEPLP